MSSYKELLAQREQLEQQIAQAKSVELKEAVASVRRIVSEYELTAEDIFGGKKSVGARIGSKVEPKYKDPATGQTWTGRGKAPLWIAGVEDRSKYAI